MTLGIPLYITSAPRWCMKRLVWRDKTAHLMSQLCIGRKINTLLFICACVYILIGGKDKINIRHLSAVKSQNGELQETDAVWVLRALLLVASCTALEYHRLLPSEVDCVWNVMAHAQKPDFVFRRKGRIHLKRQGRQFSRLLAAEVCASAVVMLDTPRSEVVWRVLATHSIRQFPLHFPSHASPCGIMFQMDSTLFGSISRETVGGGEGSSTLVNG